MGPGTQSEHASNPNAYEFLHFQCGAFLHGLLKEVRDRDVTGSVKVNMAQGEVSDRACAAVPAAGSRVLLLFARDRYF